MKRMVCVRLSLARIRAGLFGRETNLWEWSAAVRGWAELMRMERSLGPVHGAL